MSEESRGHSVSPEEVRLERVKKNDFRDIMRTWIKHHLKADFSQYF